MVVQHNISAMNANRYYGINNKALAGSLEKLSSGYAINRASDNAAGLAVSEKMRAQIGGLTQASKNAEDGISLVQTMEGALQETDSILQRMRTLAVQSANGSYQDDVDREAMQLEFDQLNDELNQIADTDFNGVVMLNGGKMADGLEATDGKFDYANKSEQLISQAKEQAQANVKAAQNKITPAKVKYEETNYDLTASGSASEYNDVDQNLMTKTDMDKLWKNLGFAKGDTATSDELKAVNEVTVTFTKNSRGEWEATDGKITGGSAENMNQSIKKTNLDTAFLKANSKDVGASTNTATGLGGVKIDIDGVTNDPNVIIDSRNAKEGDTITLVFKNGTDTKQAPKNIGFNEDSLAVAHGTGDASAMTGLSTADLTISLTPNATGGAALKDTDMTQAVKDSLDAFEDAEITTTYTATYDKDAGTAGKSTQALSIKLNGSDTARTINLTADAQTEITDDDGNVVGYAKCIASGNAEGATTGSTVDILAADGKTTLFSVTLGANSAADATGANAKNGTVSGKVSISSSAYAEGQNYGVTAGSDLNGLGLSKENKDAYDAAVANYNDAVTAMKSIKDLDSAVAFLGKDKVSVSDAFNQSGATLTYTDNLGLQVGARTKDLVNFSFSYNSNGLGDLKANLNCSAREDGLNTASLSIADQKSANDAIDKIDNALNKISMVRATFGAAQNRLEHKINTLDTNNENITAAESRIRDTQMDKEMMKFTSSQILSQASQSMLAQANSLPQGVLQLLG